MDNNSKFFKNYYNNNNVCSNTVNRTFDISTPFGDTALHRKEFALNFFKDKKMHSTVISYGKNLEYVFDAFKFIQENSSILNMELFTKLSINFNENEKENLQLDNGVVSLKKFPRVLVCFNVESSYVNLYYDNPTDFFKIVPVLRKLFKNYWKRANLTNKIFYVKSNRGQYELANFDIPNIEVSIDKNYNEDFEKIDLLLKDKLKNDNKGLAILHGLPGTGKTNYLKYLTKYISEYKKVIFLTKNIAGDLLRPDNISFLVDRCKDSIIMVEDSEQLLLTREGNLNQNNINDILNISDGIMGDLLKIQFIFTFNSNISKIDKALLRKGRLICEYKFDVLSSIKAKTFLKDSNCLDLYNSSTQYTLSELYNIKEENNCTPSNKKTIEFTTQTA